MIRLQICFERAPPNLEARRVADAIKTAGLPDSAILAVTIRFVSPSEMTQLNNRFRGGTGPTNVLTFAHGNCADIAVCPQVAVPDARIRGWDALSELAYLCVHGCLHALGFDHGDEASKNEMKRLELRVLSRMGIDAHVLRS